MEFIIDNWYIVLAFFAAGLALGASVYKFVKLTSGEQLEAVQEWLLWAVTGAEKELGSGTGKLKLRQVYDMFVVRFPWLAKVISFDYFSGMVDDALVEMREMLENNLAVKTHVEGEASEQ